MIWYWIFALVLLDHRPVSETKDTKDVRGKTVSYSLIFSALIYYMSLHTDLHYCIDTDVCWLLVYVDNILLTDFWELVLANKHRTLCDWKMNNWLTMGRRALLEKLIVSQFVEKLPLFYGTERCITIVTRATPPPLVPILNERNSVLILPFYFFKVHFNIIYQFMRRFPKWSVFFKFPLPKHFMHF